MPSPPGLPTQVFIRNVRGDAAALERTLASLEPAMGPLLEVTVTGERTARPRRTGALLVLEAGDEAS